MTDLSGIRGVGPTRLEALRAMGICSLRDLLYNLPLRYEDRTSPLPCCEAAEGAMLLKGRLQDKPKLQRFNGLTRVTALLKDDTGVIPVAWFNQPWMQQLPCDEDLMLYGRVTTHHGKLVMNNAVRVTQPSIEPVYKPVKGFQPKSYRSLVRQSLEHVHELPETLPDYVLRLHELPSLHEALKQAHFPDSLQQLKLSRRRLAFEQMLLYFALLSGIRKQKPKGYPMNLPEDAAAPFLASLPYQPTGSQRRVLDQILKDLGKTDAMSRLVQGDVGCGKTLIAFAAIYAVCQAGYQCAMMAPTQILAQQHYHSACELLEPMGIKCGLLTGSMTAAQKKKARAALENGEWQAVFGTHALISQGVGYQRLGLVITDEQHRFGVRQRSSLQDKGKTDELVPHVLVMSATPIPRSLALILFGDLDVSIVDELPPGRTPVKTRLVPQEKRSDMYGFLRKEVAAGHQCYVVCPLVDDSEQLGDVRSARSMYEDLVEHELSGLRVGLTWGNQKSAEKDEVLTAFSTGNLDVLVSTTVIEVGVNVPNASVMVIENAERFGLSQLHQLRGRVGRGSAESWCFLVTSGHEAERLRVLANTNDGFVIAQKDLELRGPGDLMGTRQSGEALAGQLLDGDIRLLEQADRCMRLLRESPQLSTELEMIEQSALQRYGDLAAHVALN